MPLPLSRRAQRFAAALDGDPAASDASTQQLVAVTGRLGTLGAAGPVPGAAARAAVLAAAAGTLAEAAKHAAAPAAHAAASSAATHAAATATQAGTAASSSVTGVAGHLLAHVTALKVVTGIAALAVLGAGAEAAAQRSVPGDPFYGLKQATESVQLTLSGGGVDAARTRLDLAKTRLAEIKALWPATPSAANSQRIADLVTELDQNVAKATEPLLRAGGTAAADLRTVVAQIQTELAALPHTLEGVGATAVTDSVTLLGSLVAVVTGLPTVVPGQGPTALLPAVPTLGVQVVAPPGGVVSPGAGSGSAPTGTSPSTPVPSVPAQHSLPGILPSVPVLPTQPVPSASAPPSGVLPSGILPTVTVPAAPTSVLPAPVGSVVCSLLHPIVGCPG